MKKVFIQKSGKFGLLVSEERQSGYWMSNIEYDDGSTETVYASQVIYTDKEYNNSEIWDLFERNNLKNEIVIKEKNKHKIMIFNKTNFYGSEFEVGDKWTLDRIK